MSNNSTESINPAWNEILNAVPQEFHSQLIPTLKKWDQGVQTKFQEIRDGYKGFENLVKNNVDPQYVEQAVILADQLQRDPQKVINQVNEAWGLGYLTKEEVEKLGQAASSTDEGSDDDLFDGQDITKHPQFKAMKEALDQLQGNYDTRRQEEEEELEAQEFEKYLDELEESYTSKDRDGGPLPFDRMFVTALISQGIDGEEAVKKYHSILATNGIDVNNISVDTEPPSTDTEDNPPVVMGGDGTTGSGSADGAVSFGAMSRNDLNSTVQDLLKKSFESGQ